jgi:hypothetical protein
MNMVIIDARGKKKTYGELEKGQCFLFDDILYMKTDIEKEDIVFAVILGSGDFAIFSEKTLIETVDAEIRYF